MGPPATLARRLPFQAPQAPPSARARINAPDSRLDASRGIRTVAPFSLAKRDGLATGLQAMLAQRRPFPVPQALPSARARINAPDSHLDASRGIRTVALFSIPGFDAAPKPLQAMLARLFRTVRTSMLQAASLQMRRLPPPQALPAMPARISAPDSRFVAERIPTVGRGRDGHCWPLPAQNRTCGFPAYGSHPGRMTAKRLP